ncbi:MAG TPA: mandelate racemase/muconate lactonizing enzyme family protein [Tepidisphaeraceae bacterium]|jgi:L-alanine-DL-glutamate epimerase-like enolase superfamily enzyme|nr:mandelate racemase/muconate lactonizing enzyme family protein [Tepidisphaeraceae bacterium]
MKIVAVDPIYLKMPKVTAAADGTQDTLLVRVRTDEGSEGWGECDASPLVSLSVYCCPMSHGNIINIRESLVGEKIDSVEDVRRLRGKVLRQGLDIQQIHHAYSGADIALWDVVGKKLGRPVYQLLGSVGPAEPDNPRPAQPDLQKKQYPKLPYASVLFGDSPEETLKVARGLRERGFRAMKFGWGPLGSKDAAFDEALVRAAREGIGNQAELMVDAGVAWGDDVDTVLERARRFAPFGVTWLEEPLHPDAIGRYHRLAHRRPAIPIAAGENCGSARAAEDYLENAGVSFIQIDAGRIGGITPARMICEQAAAKGVTYVNHTFKSRLSLAAALHVFADQEEFKYLEYPAAGSRLAFDLVKGLERDGKGMVSLPEKAGLGVEVNMEVVREFAVGVKIELSGQILFESGSL